MNSDEDKIDVINKLINSCLLPELQKDFGEVYMNANHFNEFRQNLDICLIQLFDLIQQNEHLLYNNENDTLELRFKFLLLLCEQSSSDTLYQTQNDDFLKNLNYLINKHFMKILNNDQQVFRKIFDYYKKLLNAQKWKRNIGAVHGFIKFCELYYEEHSSEIDLDTVTFLLSVGLLLREFYEPSYKQFGYNIFYLILKRTPRNIITEINIHNVIYDAVFEDLRKIDSETGIKFITECILNCLGFFKITEFHKWNQIDDLISEIIKRITLTSKAKISSILLIFLVQINLKFSNNHFDIENSLRNTNICMAHNEIVMEIKGKSSKLNSLVFYKWIKKFLQLLISESNCLMGDSKFSKELLQAMFLFYLICIFSVSVNIMDVHLKEFFNKFPLILMEVLRIHKKDAEIVKMIENWLIVFQHQICECETKDNDFLKFHKTFQKIVNHDVFKDNKEKKTSGSFEGFIKRFYSEDFIEDDRVNFGKFVKIILENLIN